jgi:hypothetical protein
MKKVLFITEAKGGLGKTLIARHCRQPFARLRYQPLAGDRPQHRLPRPTRTKNSTVVSRRY